MTEREALTSALDGPLVNRATSAGVALCPDTREQDDRARHLAPRLADDPRHGRADDRADAREPARPDEVRSPLVDELGDVTPHRPPVREHGVLQLGCAGVRRPHEEEEPAPSRRHAARKGSTESRPRYGLTVSASASAGRPS